MDSTARTALVTGAGSGIGLAVAEAFVRDGANVVLNGRTEDKLVRAAAQIGQPSRLAIIAADMTRVEAADEIVAAAVQRFGRVDVLVNNAGTPIYGELNGEQLESLRAMQPSADMERPRTLPTQCFIWQRRIG